MKKFLALYMADTAQMADMMKNSTPEQRKKGSEAWMKWMDNNKASLADRGAPVGKTKRIDAKGTKDAKNDVCGYSIVQAELADDAAKNLRERSAVLADARREDRHDRNYRDAGDIAAPPQGNWKGAADAGPSSFRIKTTAGFRRRRGRNVQDMECTQAATATQSRQAQPVELQRVVSWALGRRSISGRVLSQGRKTLSEGGRAPWLSQ